MPKKIIEPAPLELTDTGEIPVVSIDLDTSYEAMLPDPVPATSHVADNWQPMQFAPPKYENLLPIATTVLATFTLGALVLAVGVFIGAGI
jgi:hypothetical protein